MKRSRSRTEVLFRREIDGKVLTVKRNGPTYEMVLETRDSKIGVALTDPNHFEPIPSDG
jgi:hypothetical protein